MDSPHKSVTALLHSRRSSSRLSINAYGTQRIGTYACMYYFMTKNRSTHRCTCTRRRFRVRDNCYKIFSYVSIGSRPIDIMRFYYYGRHTLPRAGRSPSFSFSLRCRFFFICEHAASSSTIRILLCTNRVSFVRTLRNNTGGYGGYPIWSREFPATYYLLL